MKHPSGPLHWLCWQPTPYNDFLFSYLASDPDIHLTVHYIEPVLVSHPWQTGFAQSYQARYFRHFLGIDWHVVSLIFREKDSIFVIGSWIHPTMILLINLLGLMNRHFIIWTDTPDISRKRNLFFSFLRSSWLKWVFRKATRVMGTGQQALSNLKLMGAAENKLVEFPYWVDIDKYDFTDRRVGLQKDAALRFISSGRLINALKGHDIALRALSKAAFKTGKDFEYHIAGCGEDQDNLKSLAAQLGIKNRVFFLGWLEPEELIKHYGLCDALIHPSPAHEPYGVAVIEGMSMGLIVLASDKTCAALDRIKQGINGFIHPSGSVDILSEQISFLLDSQEKMLGIKLQARATAEEWPPRKAAALIKRIIAVSQEGK